MSRKQLQHAGLVAFFALMTIYLGANAYVVVTATRSSPGWAVSQKGELAQIVYVLEQSAAAGVVEVGDEIVAFNRRPVTDARELIALTGAEPGMTYTLGIRRGGNVREVSLRTEALPIVDAARNLVMFFVIGPLFLVFAGIIYAFKPDDKQAVLLVLIFASFMPGTPLVMHDVLPLAVRIIVALGEIGSLLMFPFFFHFFLVFPERSPLVRRFPSLEHWLYLPCALVVIPFTVLTFALLNFAPALARAHNAMLKTLLTITMVIVSGYILAGLGSLLVNYRQANKQSRRRLRVVVAGSLAGLLPLFMVSAYSALVGFEKINETLLRWLFGATIVTLLLFPLSFAYAIMRHQVIPLRLIIRRGVRYLLVSRGSKIIELSTVALALALLLRVVVTRYEATDALTLALVSSVTAIILWNLSSALHHRFVAPAIDRRFFRRAYDPQQLIAEVGEELRGTTDLERMQSIVGASLQEALQTERVAVLLRDAETGDYRSDLATGFSNDGRVMVESLLRAVLPARSYAAEQLRRTHAPLEVNLMSEETWAGKLRLATESGIGDARAEVEVLDSMKSALLVPVATHQVLLGVISLGARLGDLPFGDDDRQVLAAVALQLAYAVENAQLVRQQIAEEQLRREVEMATEVQQRLFPAHAPRVIGAELAGVCFPARGVGGDYYDFLRLDENRVGVAVADVAGKGISAALLMSTVQASLRSYAPIAASAEAEVTDLVHSMNGLLYASTSTNSYASFFYAQYDEQTRLLTYTNAGHNPPLLVRGEGEVESMTSGEWRKQRRSSSDGAAAGVAVLDAEEAMTHSGARIEWLTTGGPVIGIFERCDYEQETLQLLAGDVLVLYTDGVTEALNNNGEEFGEERLRREATSYTKLSAQEITDCLVGKLHAWCGETPQHDDITLVVMKVE